MSHSLPITVLLAARNEAKNLPRCLAALKPAARVVLLDSHSTDDTAQSAREHGAEVVQFNYTGGYPKKRQWALDTLEIRTPWVLLLDADEVVPEQLWQEIAEALREVASLARRGEEDARVKSETTESRSENAGQASSLTVHGASLSRVAGGRMPPEPADKMSAPHFQTGSDTARSASGATTPNAFLIRKEFHFLGRRFRYGGFSHQAVLLFRCDRARFERLIDNDPSGFDMEVHERVIVEGQIGKLNTPLIHEDFKGLEAYREKHHRYATWEAAVRHRFLTTGRYGEEAIEPKFFGNAQERRRWLKKLVIRIPGEPLIWFGYHYFVRGGFLEGRAGFVACQIRSQYIAEVRRKVRQASSLFPPTDK